MRSVFRVLASLVALGVLVQAAAIAFGVFRMINDVDGGAVIDSTYDSSANPGLATHSMGAMVVAGLAILLLLASFFVRFPGAKTWAVWTFVAVLAQWAFGLLAFGAPVVGLLHGANALAIFLLALLAARAAGRAAQALPTAARRPATADA
ncbi:hypothetical protein [Georgenia thermotolerans]|uniref:Uncharacterized protein n=1 Tax=Georgenia thermotolerans TaxID=527326 RepID=A0A7J5UT03_9MICO|nr:hypothetical protein [Georgenia thermotolerans]KAE8765427.1 hypothetical protein GB883_03920 [Georgenia thermotolerans]